MCINKSKRKIKIKKAVNNIYFGVINNHLNIKTFVLLSLIIFLSSFLQCAMAKSKNDIKHVIKPGAQWKYFIGTKNAPENWQDMDFDDDQWAEGPSGFGYGNNPQNGEIIENEDGTFTYIPDNGFTGTDTFKYKVQDDDGAISEAEVIVSVGEESTLGVNSAQTRANATTNNDKEKNKDKDKDKDKDKSDLKGTKHVFKDEIDDINEFPDINDDFVSLNKDESGVIDVVANDNDNDGTIVPETVLLGNSKDGEIKGMQGTFSELFVRKEFKVDDPDEIEELCLSVICDGQFIAFLNGIEIIRSEVPVNEILKVGGFAHELIPGVNVLAIKCANDDIDSSDFSFIPTLEIVEKGEK